MIRPGIVLTKKLTAVDERLIIGNQFGKIVIPVSLIELICQQSCPGVKPLSQFGALIFVIIPLEIKAIGHR